MWVTGAVSHRLLKLKHNGSWQEILPASGVQTLPSEFIITVRSIIPEHFFSSNIISSHMTDWWRVRQVFLADLNIIERLHTTWEKKESGDCHWPPAESAISWIQMHIQNSLGATWIRKITTVNFYFKIHSLPTMGQIPTPFLCKVVHFMQQVKPTDINDTL